MAHNYKLDMYEAAAALKPARLGEGMTSVAAYGILRDAAKTL